MASINGKKINNASIPMVKEYVAAGVNPVDRKTPIKGAPPAPCFKDKNKILLRIMDEQDAINRFTWYNLPNGLSGNLIERILYYRGTGMFFYMESADQFFFLPYAMGSKGIDVYGRFQNVTPLPFNGVSQEKDKKLEPWIKGLEYDVQHDIMLEALTVDYIKEHAVILFDYSPQQNYDIISRQILQDPLLDTMADCIPFMHTALLNSTGIMGMRVNGEDEQSNVEAASNAITRAALEGKKYVPIIGNIDFQELTGGQVGKSEEFLLAMQSLDNYRLSMYGLDNGGLFQKKSHMLQDEQNMNAGHANLVMQDALTNRQNFCDIVNSLTGLGIWCEISEPAVGIDRDMDGEISDNDPDTSSYAGGNSTEGGESDESV